MPESEASENDVGRILASLHSLHRKVDQIMADLTSLANSVKQNTTVVGSVETLLTGIAAQLKAAGTDPAALAALQAQLDSDDAGLAQAVKDNTPTTPPTGTTTGTTTGGTTPPPTGP